jgi:predicted site-specific integrase-resolvase
MEKIFGKDRRTLKRWRAQGKLDDILFMKAPGGRWVAVKESVKRWLQEQMEMGVK